MSIPSGVGGTWRIAYGGEASGPLSPTISSADLKSVLDSTWAIDNVTVTGMLGNYTITFGGTQSSTNMAQLMVDGADLESGPTLRTIASTYNSADELSQISDPSATITYTRDNWGRTTTVASALGFGGMSASFNQIYDAAGNRLELLATGNGTLDFRNVYGYDRLNRMTEAIQFGQMGGNVVNPKRVAFTYNALGQRTQMARFQSTGTTNPVATTDFTYDAANRLSSMAHKQGTTNVNTYSFTYDVLSRLNTVTSSAEGTTTYSYNPTSQLVGAINTGVPNEAFSYDANGNHNSSGYTTTADNRTTASPGVTYQYDDEGNIKVATNSATGVALSFTWDYRDRLTQVIVSAGGPPSTITYDYDAFNRMVRRSTSTSTFYWVYDEGINPLMEFNSAVPGFLTHRYFWSDNVDELLSDDQFPGTGSNNILWPLVDQLGSVRDVADRNETTGVTSVVNHRRFDSFGKLLSETNSAFNIPFGYTGKYSDSTTGMQYNWNRWYNPGLGKWLSQDPIGFGGSDANLYRYVGNSPLNATDSSGLEENPIVPYIIKNLKNHKIASGDGYRDPEFWEIVDGRYMVKPGVSAVAAIKRLWTDKQSEVFCEKLSALIMIKAVIDYAEDLSGKDDPVGDEILSLLNAYLSGKYIGEESDTPAGVIWKERKSESTGWGPDKFSVGDQIWFKNLYFDRRRSGRGEEGTNRFWGDQNKVITLLGAETTCEGTREVMTEWIPNTEVKVAIRKAQDKSKYFPVLRIRRVLPPEKIIENLRNAVGQQ